VISAPPILPGETKDFVFRIFSTRGHDIAIALLYDSAFERHFTAPTTFPPAVPAGGSIDVTVAITCVPDTPPGPLNGEFRITSPDGSQPLGSFEFPVTVAPFPGPPPVDPSVTTSYFVVSPDTDRLARLADLAVAGRLRVVVDSVYPLERAREAFARAQSRGRRGKVVLRVGGT